MAYDPKTLSNRVFVDTSALFAAIRSSRGYARDLVNAGIDGQVELCISAVVLDETTRNLSKKGTAAELAFFGDVLSLDVLTLNSPPPDLVARVSRHVEFKDAPIVAAAITAEASMLATYDQRHLLSRAGEIRHLFNIAVVTREEIICSLPSEG